VKCVIRRKTYRDDLQAITDHIAQDSPGAAARLRLHIDDQVSKLADPNFPRRRGRVAGTKELVAHENYIAIIIEDDTSVTALNVVHVRQKYP
jgi:plasmid stabilization system protein ParE